MFNKATIKIVSLYLDMKNPRRESISQVDAIQWLCENEKIDALAEDIVKNGLNPLELTGVLKLEDNAWYALEGNRRICALKLLIEPELSPNLRLKTKFKQLKSKWTKPFDELECVCFTSREDADIWLDRLHQGEQNGHGRSQWNATQKQRRSNNIDNKLSLLVLDYAVLNEWITSADFDKKLTTATRYLNNELLRKNIGISNNNGLLAHSRPIEIFNQLLKKFILDLIEGTVKSDVSSRADKQKIETYAASLLQLAADKSTHEEKNILDKIPVNQLPPTNYPKTNPQKKASKPKPPPPPPSIAIAHSHDITKQLADSANTKLSSLYYSLCKLNLDDRHNVPLAAVGVWSFVESLTRLCGRDDTADFSAFVMTKIQKTTALDKKAIKTALVELTKQGNLTKHDRNYALFDALTIATTMDTLNPLIVYLLENKNNNQ